MSIEKNIADRRAAEDLHQTLGEILRDDVPRLPSDESRVMFWRLMRASVEKNLPGAGQSVLTTPKEVVTPTETTNEVADALGMADEIEELATQLPAEGEDFGMSVVEKAGDIARNIAAHNRVTAGQVMALENMLEGLQRWFHD